MKTTGYYPTLSHCVHDLTLNKREEFAWKHLAKHMRNAPPVSIDETKIALYFDLRRLEHAAYNSIRYEVIVLTSILKACGIWPQFKIPPSAETKKRILTDAEYRRLASAVTDDPNSAKLSFFINATMNTGRLPHEILTKHRKDLGPGFGIYRIFKRATVAAKLKGVTPLDLRRTAIAWMIEGGRSYEEVAALAGVSAASLRRQFKQKRKS